MDSLPDLLATPRAAFAAHRWTDARAGFLAARARGSLSAADMSALSEAVSLAEGGAGLGTVWGEELALDMLAAAGFVDIEVHEIPGDPIDSVNVPHKPS